MTKILIISPHLTLPGGVSNYIKLLNQYLEQEKFDVKYLFIGKSGSAWKDLFYPFLILKQIINLKKRLKDFRPDLVHINPSLTYTAIIRDFLFLRIIKKEHYPVVFFVHGWREDISDKFYYTLVGNFFKKRFDMADAIVVMANRFKEALVGLEIYAAFPKGFFNKLYSWLEWIEKIKIWLLPNRTAVTINFDVWMIFKQFS